MMRRKNIIEVLKENIGSDLEISYVFLQEGKTLYTRGILREVTDELIVIVCKHKEHRYSKTERVSYYLNRRSCVLQSVVIYGEQEKGGGNMAEKGEEKKKKMRLFRDPYVKVEEW